MARLHPQLITVDFIRGDEVTASRLRRNHVNFNFAYDTVIAVYSRGKARGEQIKSMFNNPTCRMWPSFDYYDWVCTKSRYLKQCKKVGIPIIDTIFVEDGLDPKKILKQ